jgi:hypothetical protein
MMGVGAATSIARLGMLRREADFITMHGRWWGPAMVLGVRYIDDVRLLLAYPTSSKHLFAGDRFSGLVNSIYGSNLPWKRDSLNPFVGLHLFHKADGGIGYWSCQKSQYPGGRPALCGDGAQIITLQSWFSWGDVCTKKGALLGAFSRAVEGSCCRHTAILGVLSACEAFVKTAHYPATFVFSVLCIFRKRKNYVDFPRKWMSVFKNVIVQGAWRDLELDLSDYLDTEDPMATSWYSQNETEW